MQQNQPHKLSGCFSTVLLFLLAIKSIDSLKEKQKKPIRLTPFLKKEKPITGTLEYDKRRRGSRCNFIKKRNTNMYQGKACHHAYTNLSLVLIITSQNYISHQKILMKSAATVLSGKCPRVLILKRDIQSIQVELIYWHATV